MRYRFLSSSCDFHTRGWFTVVRCVAAVRFEQNIVLRVCLPACCHVSESLDGAYGRLVVGMVPIVRV